MRPRRGNSEHAREQANGNKPETTRCSPAADTAASTAVVARVSRAKPGNTTRALLRTNHSPSPEVVGISCLGGGAGALAVCLSGGAGRSTVYLERKLL